MVAKDYPIYLSAKRASWALEERTVVRGPHRGAEVLSKRCVKSSLSSLISPEKATPQRRVGRTVQRSLRNEGGADSQPLCSWSQALPSMARQRDSKLWSETFDLQLCPTLTAREVKRQEAIFELSKGEQDLIEDLKLAKRAYHHPMLKLSIMSEQELTQIFSTLDSLIPLHEDLLRRLQEARKPDGSTEYVGHILLEWLPCLRSYSSYCSNQVAAKALLDHKKQDGRVQDFLQRCLESPFSRRLDLWSFLDVPRSRLVKYPLLLREILRHTPSEHADWPPLGAAISMVQGIVAEIDAQTGESECRYYKEHLLYQEESQRDPLIDQSRVLSCHGDLRNSRGTKLHVFLFQGVLVVTRTVAHRGQLWYQLQCCPLPLQELECEDLQDGEISLGGSLRGAFSHTQRTKNLFRVTVRSGQQERSLCFQASDAFCKQQWLNCLRQAKSAAASGGGASGGGAGGGGAGRGGAGPTDTPPLSGQERLHRSGREDSDCMHTSDSTDTAQHTGWSAGSVQL
ncbi:rho guanine nucleotide exchange factor 3-like [Megalops cyprinoides]|uniref:rho guanine nucleotide exchange factor 3-like n=1 Tax=Megalops cyprinoides TaxID=118141 RepID=UPI0018648BD2|nr:rho guanine nucleotide exchange factor 3-like [Megalops cyprinoides]